MAGTAARADSAAAQYAEAVLPNALVDDLIQLCVVTEDLDGMVRSYADRLGIGPWWIQDHAAPDLQDTKVRGRPTALSMRVALAWSRGFNWEIIQPLEGPSVYWEYLLKYGPGVQHVAVRPRDRSFDEAYGEFLARGFKPLQECQWRGVRVAYFQTEDAAGTAFELLDFPPGYQLPEPDRWYPARP
jgi:hypothetical protein